jgi:DNA-binding MarR family transcriptional regulator
MLIAQTATAVAAFHDHSASGKKEAQQLRILAFITNRGGDWSIGELAKAMGMEKSTVSGRVNELLYETKQLIEATRRKDRVSGIEIRPVMLPPEQWELGIQ